MSYTTSLANPTKSFLAQEQKWGWNQTSCISVQLFKVSFTILAVRHSPGSAVRIQIIKDAYPGGILTPHKLQLLFDFTLLCAS